MPAARNFLASACPMVTASRRVCWVPQIETFLFLKKKSKIFFTNIFPFDSEEKCEKCYCHSNEWPPFKVLTNCPLWDAWLIFQKPNHLPLALFPANWLICIQICITVSFNFFFKRPHYFSDFSSL
jgi:hypothetical protein